MHKLLIADKLSQGGGFDLEERLGRNDKVGLDCEFLNVLKAEECKELNAGNEVVADVEYLDVGMNWVENGVG